MARWTDSSKEICTDAFTTRADESGSVELYNTFKKMNTSIKFKQPVMRLERVVNNRDAEDEVLL
jgi:hypothetical protein